jgi:hypothetical protein
MKGDNERWRVDCADCLDWLGALAPDSLDLLLCSPPYEAARTYGVDFKLRGQAWVDWMVAVVRAALRVTRGLVAVVCEGQTRDYRWSAARAPCGAPLALPQWRWASPTPALSPDATWG